MLILGPSDTILQQVEPVRAHWWSLVLSGPPSIGVLPALEGLSLRELPSLGNEQEALSHTPLNRTIKYPGKQLPSSPQLRLTMFDTDPVYTFLARWRKLCFDPVTQLAGLLSEVAGLGIVRIYAPSTSNTTPVLIREITIELVWPSSLVITGLSREREGEPVEYQVTLEIGNSYDANV